MPRKRKVGSKDSAAKNTFNPPELAGPKHGSREPDLAEQNAKRRVGQFSEAGNPPLQKK
jgi:hypothetical protein